MGRYFLYTFFLTWVGKIQLLLHPFYWWGPWGYRSNLLQVTMLSGLAELVPSSSSRASEFWNSQHEPHASLFCHISVWTLLCHTIRNQEPPGITSHAQLGWCPSWVFSSPGVLGGCRGLVLLIFVSLSSVSQSAGCFPGKTGSDFLSSVEAGRWQRIS